MSDSISALPSLPATDRRDPSDVDVPDVREMRFRELWSDKEAGFRFADLLDIVNPLQHLPVIGTIYRAITGDEISLGARIAGGALFGGPLGVIGAAALAASEEATGAEPGRHIVAAITEMFGGKGPDKPSAVAKGDSPETLADIAPAAGETSRQAESDLDASWAKVVRPVASSSDPNEAAASRSPDAAAAPARPAQDQVRQAPAKPVVEPGIPATPAAANFSARPAAPTALREFPAFPAQRMPASRGVPPVIRPGLGPLRSEPALPVSPARGPIPLKAAPRAEAGQDAESRRILAAVEEARRAQAALLLSSLNATPAVALPNPGAGSEAESRRDHVADPFSGHPLIRPPGATPAWTHKAMERALDRYRQAQQLPRAAGSRPAGASPVPVQ